MFHPMVQKSIWRPSKLNVLWKIEDLVRIYPEKFGALILNLTPEQCYYTMILRNSNRISKNSAVWKEFIPKNH